MQEKISAVKIHHCVQHLSITKSEYGKERDCHLIWATWFYKAAAYRARFESFTSLQDINETQVVVPINLLGCLPTCNLPELTHTSCETCMS